MKKLIIFVVCCIMLCSDAKALDYDSYVNIDEMDTIYLNYYMNGQKYSMKQGVVSVNGLVAYSLNPMNVSTSYLYSSSIEFYREGISDMQLKYLQIVNYYGYGYEGRTDDMYYLATQSIIWEYLKGWSLIWTLGENGEVINLDNYKNEILSSVNNYLKEPDIPTYIQTNHNNEVILEFNNNELEYYETDSQLVVMDKNILMLNADIIGTYEIRLDKIDLNSGFSLIYFNDGYQSLATFGETLPSVLYIDYKVKNTSRIKLLNKDENTNKIIKNRPTKIKIYDVENEKYITENNNEIITIGNDGIYQIEQDLGEGEYVIEVIENPFGYEQSNSKITFNIYEDSEEIIEVDIDNTELLYDLTINKKGEIYDGLEEKNLTGKYTISPLDKVIYGIYAKENILDGEGNVIHTKDSLVEQINIVNGIGAATNLKYGIYYIKELECPSEYKLNEELVYLNLTENTTEIELNFTNELKKGDIIINIKDDTKGLEGAEFNLDGYKLISDENGYIYLNDIPYGTYSLLETNAPTGYQIDSEIKTITLDKLSIRYEIINKKESELPDEPITNEEVKSPIDEEIIEEEIESSSGKDNIKIDESELPDEPITNEEVKSSIDEEIIEEDIENSSEKDNIKIEESELPDIKDSNAEEIEPPFQEFEQDKIENSIQENLSEKDNLEEIEIENVIVHQATVENPPTFVGIKNKYYIVHIIAYIGVIVGLYIRKF